MQIEGAEHCDQYANCWAVFYSANRPHTGYGRNNQTSLHVLRQLGYSGGDSIAYMPRTLLDDISADTLLNLDPEHGYHELTQWRGRRRGPARHVGPCQSAEVIRLQ